MFYYRSVLNIKIELIFPTNPSPTENLLITLWEFTLGKFKEKFYLFYPFKETLFMQKISKKILIKKIFVSNN